MAAFHMVGWEEAKLIYPWEPVGLLNLSEYQDSRGG